jgi:hypothetical protein
MTDLSSSIGVSVLIDDDNGEIRFEDGLGIKENRVSLNEITPVLLNKYLKYPEVVYTQHSKIKTAKCNNCEVDYNVFMIPYGLLGVEFMKTHVFYTDLVESKYASLVEVLSGELSVIIQRNGDKEDEWDMNTYVEELKVIKLHKGNKLAIPTGVYYSFVNTGLSSTVFSVISSSNRSNIDYEVFRREKGLACFIISKNSKVATVTNPKYKIRGTLELLTYDELCGQEECRCVFIEPIETIDGPLIDLMDKTDLLGSYIY